MGIAKWEKGMRNKVDAMGDMYRGTSTLGLVATSVHPLKAGLQKELIDILLKYGADINHAVAPDYTMVY